MTCRTTRRLEFRDFFLLILIFVACWNSQAQGAGQETVPSEPIDLDPSGVARESEDSWPAFGGPLGNFRVANGRVAARWDAAPRTLWELEFGPGFSSIVGDSIALYTMYGRDKTETTVALDARSGATLWEKTYPVDHADMVLQHGSGPQATPLLHGEILVTAGFMGSLRAWDRRDGSLLWTHELIETYGAKGGNRGYAVSPLKWRDSVIVMVGGEGKFMMAFDVLTGQERWRGGSFDYNYSSPRIIQRGGRSEVVAMTEDLVVALDPDSGTVIWTHPHDLNGGPAMAVPLQNEGTLFVSSGSGSRALRLDGEPVPEQIWHNARGGQAMGSAALIGDTVYFSTGGAARVLTAVRLRDGETLWRSRRFQLVNLLTIDDRALLLDENGTLALVRLSPDGMEVLGECQVFNSRSWTVPTLIGSSLYLRNERRLVALDVGPR